MLGACAGARASAAAGSEAVQHELQGRWQSADGKVLLSGESRGGSTRLSNGRIEFDEVAGALTDAGGRYAIQATLTQGAVGADVVQRGMLRVRADTAILIPPSGETHRLLFRVRADGELELQDSRGEVWRFRRVGRQ